MAFSPTDPAAAHSLWLQLRSTKRNRRHGWRSDWTPLWLSLLLFSALATFYALMPSIETVKQVEQSAQQETDLQGHSMRGTLVAP